MKDKFSVFGLTIEQTEVLFLLQWKIICNDVNVCGDNKRPEKQNWLEKWERSITYYLKSHGGNLDDFDLSNYTLKSKAQSLDKNAQNKVWKYMVLLECAIYCPYYPLSENKDDYKRFKGLKLNKGRRRKTLEEIAEILEIDQKYIAIFQDSYKSARNRLSGFWTKMLIGAGAGIIAVMSVILIWGPAILAFFAANGLHGAAAVSASLAALGGGAVAAGGLGMSGGMVVLIGGGVLLGASSGATVGASIASLGSDGVLSEAAKLQVVLKEIVLAIQKDTAYFQQILLNINKQIYELKKQVINLKNETENNKDKIKDLEKSIEILEKLVKSSS